MRGFIFAVTIIFSVLLVSCSKSNMAVGPHATVYLRDGSTYAGTVTGSSPAEVTVQGDDKTTRTIAMKDVKSIEYDDASAPASETAAAKPSSARELSHERHRHPDESAIKTKTYSLQAGTDLSVRTEETIDSDKAAEGQTYPAEVTKDVLDANGDVVIPSGANATIVIRSASKGGRFRGTSDLVLDLASVAIGGRQYQLSTENLVRKGKTGFGGNKRTAEYTGGGAAIGAIIGAIAGHGKGAAIGAASGAGAGAITQVVTKGGSIKVPAETILTFKLDQPLQVVAAR